MRSKTTTINQREKFTYEPLHTDREYSYEFSTEITDPRTVTASDPGLSLQSTFQEIGSRTLETINLDPQILNNIPGPALELGKKLLADPKLSRLGERYLKCQSNQVFIRMVKPQILKDHGFDNTILGRSDFNAHYTTMSDLEKEQLGDGVQYAKQTCDNKFCDDPLCVAHRNKKVIDTYQPVLKFLWNPNPRARFNLRGIELTSDLLPTPENLKIFKKKVRSFFKLKTMQRYVFCYIASFHIHQSRIHAHIIAWCLYLPAQHLTKTWNSHTGWRNTNIKQIKGGLRSHLGHLSKYIAKPFTLKGDPDNAVEIIKGFYKRRLITTAGIKNAMKRHKADLSNEYVRIGPEFIRRSLISIKRNNSNPELLKIQEEIIYEDQTERDLILLEQLGDPYG